MQKKIFRLSKHKRWGNYWKALHEGRRKLNKIFNTIIQFCIWLPALFIHCLINVSRKHNYQLKLKDSIKTLKPLHWNWSPASLKHNNYCLFIFQISSKSSRKFIWKHKNLMLHFNLRMQKIPKKKFLWLMFVNVNKTDFE